MIKLSGDVEWKYKFIENKSTENFNTGKNCISSVFIIMAALK